MIDLTKQPPYVEQLKTGVRIRDGSPSSIQDDVLALLTSLEQLGCGIEINADSGIHPGGNILIRHGGYIEKSLSGSLCTDTITELTRTRDSVTVKNGISNLRYSCAQLGFEIVDDGKGKIFLYETKVTKMETPVATFDRNPIGLRQMQDYVEKERLLRELNDHQEEFRQVGILVQPSYDFFNFTLRENDKPMYRHLTAENVAEVIAITGAIAACRKPAN